MKKSNITSKIESPSFKNSHLGTNLDLKEALKKAKEKDPDAILTLMNKYSPLVEKYSRIYKLKNYDPSDLKQEGNIAILNAIDKFDLSKNPNIFNGYAINSIKNKYGTLARIHIKRNTESSLNISTNTDDFAEIINLIEDPTNIEDTYIKSEEISKLNLALSSLSKEELTLINAIYINKSHSLLKYCKENNLPYTSSRKRLKKSLEKLHQLIQ